MYSMATPRKDPKDLKKRGRKLYWTEERAVALGERILAWMYANPETLVPSTFFSSEESGREGLYHDLPAKLASDYPSFQRLWVRIGSMAEERIVKGAMEANGKINSKFAQFYLERRAANFYPGPSKVHVEHAGEITQTNKQVNVNFIVKTAPTGACDGKIALAELEASKAQERVKELQYQRARYLLDYRLIQAKNE